MLVASSGQNKVCMCVILASKWGEGGKEVISSERQKNIDLMSTVAKRWITVAK